jgi:hypothetical protein
MDVGLTLLQSHRTRCPERLALSYVAVHVARHVETIFRITNVENGVCYQRVCDMFPSEMISAYMYEQLLT